MTPGGPMDRLGFLRQFTGVAVPTPQNIAEAITAYAKQAAAKGNTTLHASGTIKPNTVGAPAELLNVLDVRGSASFTTDAAEAGKEADLRILESDPYTCDPERIDAITVWQTWVAGEKKSG